MDDSLLPCRSRRMDGEPVPVTRDQAEALASLALACRPTGARRWDGAGVVAAIAKVHNLSLADVAMATVRAAADRSLETPGAIANTRAPCWSERVAERTAPRNPRPLEACRTCGNQYGPMCCDNPIQRGSVGPGVPSWFREIANAREETA